MRNENLLFITKIPMDDVFRNTYGNKELIIKKNNGKNFFINFTDMMEKHKREEELFMKFLEFNNIQFDIYHYYGNNILVCNEPTNFQKLFNEFIEIFCKCSNCENTITEYDIENRKVAMYCKKCYHWKYIPNEYKKIGLLCE